MSTERERGRKLKLAGELQAASFKVIHRDTCLKKAWCFTEVFPRALAIANYPEGYSAEKTYAL